MEVVTIEDITSNKLVCPFRTEAWIKQEIDENLIPIQKQITVFPECHYIKCPFYNSKAKDNNERCFRINNLS